MRKRRKPKATFAPTTTKLYDAFPTRHGALRVAKDLNKAVKHSNCPGGPKAVARKLYSLGNHYLKFGVYVTNPKCKIY